MTTGPWTANERRIAAEILHANDQAGLRLKETFVQITRMLKRSWHAVANDYYAHNKSFDGSRRRERTYRLRGRLHPEPLEQVHPSSAALTERARRSEAYDARDLTAAICGDPPKGYSALDRRRP